MLLLTYPSPLITTATSQLLTSLVAYYKLGEASSTRNDTVGTSHLSPNGSVGQVTGKQGNGATFTRASGQWLSCSDNAAVSLNGTSWNISFWARMASKPIDGDGNMAAVAKWDYNTTNREYSIGYNSTNDRFNVSVSSNGTLQTHLYATASTSPALNTWYFISAWYDSVNGTLNIQVNDGPVTSVAYTAGVFNGAASFSIGAMAASNDLWWNGDIDEVGVWKRVLSANERKALYALGAGATHPFSAVPAFTPADVFGLYNWWAADAITGKVDGDPVGTWTDSKSSIALTQATGSAQPLYRASGPGSKPYLDLSAGDKWMSASSVAISSGFTMFMVFAGTAALSSGARIVEFNNATAANQGRVRFTASGWGMFAGSNAAATSGPQTATGTYVAGNWLVSAMRWQNAANAHLIANGAVRTSTGDMSLTTPTGFWLGSSITGSNRSNIYVAEMLVYNASVATTDEQTILAYLNTKYGGVY